MTSNPTAHPPGRDNVFAGTGVGSEWTLSVRLLHTCRGSLLIDAELSDVGMDEPLESHFNLLFITSIHNSAVLPLAVALPRTPTAAIIKLETRR
jgi:hypothetical protein